MSKKDIIVIPHSLKTETGYFNDEIEVLIVVIVQSRTFYKARLWCSAIHECNIDNLIFCYKHQYDGSETIKATLGRK